MNTKTLIIVAILVIVFIVIVYSFYNYYSLQQITKSTKNTGSEKPPGALSNIATIADALAKLFGKSDNNTNTQTDSGNVFTSFWDKMFGGKKEPTATDQTCDYLGDGDMESGVLYTDGSCRPT